MIAAARREARAWWRIVRDHDYHLLALALALVAFGRGVLTAMYSDAIAAMHPDPAMRVLRGVGWMMAAAGLALGVRGEDRVIVYNAAMLLGSGWLYGGLVLSLHANTVWPQAWSYAALGIAAFVVALKARAG